METSKGQGNFIGNVIPGSPAHDAGLLQGDRIIEVNGVNVERETIQKVTQRINPKSSETTLLVVDRTTDQLFKDERKRISSDMPLVRKISTRPRVQSKFRVLMCLFNCKLFYDSVAMPGARLTFKQSILKDFENASL